MKEIGSEFWEVPITQQENDIFENAKWFLSGRDALRAIIMDIMSNTEFKTIALPSWCCESMIRPILDNGIEVSFYPVYFKEELTQDLSNIDTDVVLLMDYFGYTTQTRIINYKGIIIRDVTHSVFSNTYTDADYYFGSLRKWAGFWTAGFAWDVNPFDEEAKEYTNLRKEAMDKKKNYMTDKSTSKEYLNIFEEAENYLDNNKSISKASDRDIGLVKKMDVEKVNKTRIRNARILLEEFKDIAIFKSVNDNDCPMFVPILVPDGKRDELRQYLIDREIYCPVHWPVSEYHELTTKTGRLYRDELSLVCDQRYNENDMFLIIETIKKFWKEQ